MPRSLSFAIAAALLLCLPPSAARSAEVELHGHAFTLPDGFKLELAAGSPLVERPISAAFDDDGRLYVTEASGTNAPSKQQLIDKPHRVVRLEDTDGDGRFDRRTVFADNMMLPEGAMWLAGSLYVAAPPSIWKLTDTDGDGVADQRVEWFDGKTLNGCANDLHGPYLGPDGWIYWCKGAFNEQTYERPGKPPLVTRASHIFRARPDGTGIEPVMTGGMDNPVEVAFDRTGEIFFTSTFVQQPAGGRRDGIIHAVYGGLYGKVHNVIDDQIHTSPDVLPVMTHLGPAAPSGLMCYQSKTFGKEYQQNLFATLFNLHKVTRHQLLTDGATFKTEDSDFLVAADLDFHPTDVLEDADGSLLVIDTGGWYKLCCPTSQLVKPDVVGGIYRITTDFLPDDPRGKKILWADLPAQHVARFLSDVRFAVAEQAANELVRRRTNDAYPVQKGADNETHLIRSLWALARVDSEAARVVIRENFFFHEPVRATALRVISLLRDRAALPALVEKIPNHLSARTQRLAAEALGRIGDPTAVPAIFEALKTAQDEIVAHALTYALIEIATPTETVKGLQVDNPKVQRAALMALGQMPDGALRPEQVTRFMTAKDASLREAAAWVCGRHPEWGETLVGYYRQQFKAERPVFDMPEEFQRQLAGFAGSAKIQDLMAETVGNRFADMEVRCVVLQAMSDSRLKQVPQSWVDVLTAVLSRSDEKLAAEAIRAAKSLPIRAEQAAELTPKLLETASNPALNAELRLTALAMVPGGLKQPSAAVFEFLAEQARPGQPVTSRATSADILAKTRLSPEQLLAVAEMLRSATPVELERLLAAVSQSTNKELGLKAIQALSESTALRSLRADALKTTLKKFGPDVAAPAAELVAKLEAATAEQAAKINELLGSFKDGDVRRGQVVFNSRKAVCVSCHAIGYVGGKVGPDLTKIGQIRSERDLLEAIVLPSASFVRSYEPIQVVTTSGKIFSGLIRSETAAAITLVTGPDQEARISREDVEETHPGTVSVMPAGLEQQLTRQELADLVTFLKACK